MKVQAWKDDPQVLVEPDRGEYVSVVVSDSCEVIVSVEEDGKLNVIFDFRDSNQTLFRGEIPKDEDTIIAGYATGT